MAKISLGLVFALVLSVTLHSVLCDDNPWQSVIEQAKSEAAKAGLSEDTIFGAEKAVADGSAKRAAEEALNSGTLNDWVQESGVMGSSSGAAQSLLDDEEEDSIGELEFAPRRSPSEGPSEAPAWAPSEQILLEELTMELTEELVEEPSEAPSPSKD